MIIIDIKSNEIEKNVNNIIKNIYTNIKDEKQFKKYLRFQLSNYYIICLQNNINCKIEWDKDENFKQYNILEMIRQDYNVFFKENVNIKNEEDVTIIIKSPDNQ